jgi:hypothetical protein
MRKPFGSFIHQNYDYDSSHLGIWPNCISRTLWLNTKNVIKNLKDKIIKKEIIQNSRIQTHTDTQKNFMQSICPILVFIRFILCIFMFHFSSFHSIRCTDDDAECILLPNAQMCFCITKNYTLCTFVELKSKWFPLKILYIGYKIVKWEFTSKNKFRSATAKFWWIFFNADKYFLMRKIIF